MVSMAHQVIRDFCKFFESGLMSRILGASIVLLLLMSWAEAATASSGSCPVAENPLFAGECMTEDIEVEPSPEGVDNLELCSLCCDDYSLHSIGCQEHAYCAGCWKRYLDVHAEKEISAEIGVPCPYFECTQKCVAFEGSSDPHSDPKITQALCV